MRFTLNHFFLRGEKWVLVSKSFVKGWTNEFFGLRPLPVSMILVEPRGYIGGRENHGPRDSTPSSQVALLVWKALCNLNARAVPWNSRRVNVALALASLLGSEGSCIYRDHKMIRNLGTKSWRTEFYCIYINSEDSLLGAYFHEGEKTTRVQPSTCQTLGIFGAGCLHRKHRVDTENRG